MESSEEIKGTKIETEKVNLYLNHSFPIDLEGEKHINAHLSFCLSLPLKTNKQTKKNTLGCSQKLEILCSFIIN